MAESQWPAARVRQTFFDYFAARGHTIGKFPRHHVPAVQFDLDAIVNCIAGPIMLCDAIFSINSPR